MEMKECTKCHETKPVVSFGKRNYAPHAPRSWCKACMAELSREKRKKCTLDMRRYDRMWYRANAERLKQYYRDRRLEKKLKASGIVYGDGWGEIVVGVNV